MNVSQAVQKSEEFNKTLDYHDKLLDEAMRLTKSSVLTGNQILSELQLQGERIEKIDRGLESINEDREKSDRIAKRMGKRNRCVIQ